MAAYPLIQDWSQPARAALVEAHRARMALLLEHSLGKLARHHGEERLLSAFGFKTLGEAIDFCLERFAHGDLDPKQLHPESRSFRLFTEARFWLAQKVGKRACSIILARLEAGLDQTPPSQGSEPTTLPEEPGNLDVERLVNRLAVTLRRLRECTCADLVAWWLHATDALRESWFEPPPVSPEWEPSHKKERSSRAHDAAFRFQCLYRGLIQDGAQQLTHVAAREWLFRKCANIPPYRRSETEIAAALPATALKSKQEIWRLRREGVEALLGVLVQAARHRPSSQDPVARMEWQLLRQVLVKTTLVAFKLDEGKAPELERQMATLPGLLGQEEVP